MIKIMIHTCKDRFWYVNNFLIPSILQQGIENIETYVDSTDEGVLKSCMDAFKGIEGDGHTWHLQDDVVICKDFKEQLERYEDFNGIVCGICTRYDGEAKDFHSVISNDLLKMWFSFPCIRIPDILARACAFHFEHAQTTMYDKYKKRGTGDDAVFRKFIRNSCPSVPYINAVPNLVDHIDYLLGGSITAKVTGKSGRPCPAIYFDESIAKELATKIEVYKNEKNDSI